MSRRFSSFDVPPEASTSANGRELRPGGSRWRRVAGFLLTLVLLSAPLLADPPGYDRSNSRRNQFVLRAAVAEQGVLANQYGLTVRGHRPGDEDLVLVEGPETLTPTEMLNLVAGDSRIETIESVELASLPPLAGATVSDPGATIWNDLARGDHGGTSCLARSRIVRAWQGYSAQTAVERIRLAEAHAKSQDCGAVTVAVIDTGVDPEHPVLSGSLLPGYDFLLDQPGTASEWSVLDQSVEAILEESMRAIADQSVEAILEGRGEMVMLEASVGAVIDPDMVGGLDGVDLPPYFGHGTLVSGLILLVAPEATILPLRVFDGNGQGHLFDIVRAIYYAVDHGADVINMSFSMENPSPELNRAIRYARNHGVVCVAAAGNSGELTEVYPAANSKVVGIASTTDGDTLSTFSNFGPSLVDLGAPGDGVISTFPGGLFAAGWGTSFSTPLVAGTVALISDEVAGSGTGAHRDKVRAVHRGAETLPSLGSLIGWGRLDVEASLDEVQ